MAKTPPLAGELALGELLPAQLGELAEQVLLGGVEFRRRVHLQVDLEVAAAVAAQVGDAQPAEGDDLAGLGAGLDVDLLLAVERVERISVPSAAAVIGMLRLAWRSSPSRT